MNNLNQIELQNVRHICTHCMSTCEKITYFKTLTQDTNITTELDKYAAECKNLKSTLCNML